MKPEEQNKILPKQNAVPDWVMPIVRALIVSVDGALAFAVFGFSFWLRESLPIFRDGSWNWSDAFAPYGAVVLVSIPITISCLWYYNSYSFKGAFSYVSEASSIIKACLVCSLLLISFTFIYRGGFEFREFSYARGIFLFQLIFSIIVFTAFHLSIRFIQTIFRRRGVNLIPTLVVGDGEEANETISFLNANSEFGYEVIGRVAVSTEQKPSTNEQTEVVGGIDNLATIIRELQIQEVIITDSGIPKSLLFETMMNCGRSRKIEFRLAPSLINYLPQKTSVDQIGVLPMVTLFREPLSDAERILKRTSDILMALAALLILAPLLLLIAIAVRLSSAGPIFFRQQRVGMDGRTFVFYKFRSMFTDSDESLHREAYLKNIKNEGANDQSKTDHGKVTDDPRITPLGRLLRRTSADELPQLLNVLIGDMSVVGPRPPIPYEVEEYNHWHRKRLDMKPGITGLWQVSGRNRLTFEEMVRIDLYYIENWSLFLDFKILLQTLPAVFRGEGER